MVRSQLAASTYQVVAAPYVSRQAVQDAVDALPVTGGVVEVVDGPIAFDRPVLIDKPNVSIRLHPNVKLILVNRFPVGLFHFAAGADNCELVGRALLSSELWEAGQRWVLFESVMYPRIVGLRFQADAFGRDIDPAVMLAVEESFAVEVHGCRFAPDQGFLGLLLRGGRYRFSVVNNIFGTIDPSGMHPSAGILPKARHATGAVRVVGSGFGHLNDNWFWFLGDAAHPIEYALRFDRYLSGQVVENGHLVISGNQFEGVAARRCVVMNGLATAIFTGNAFGYAQGFPVNVGDAALYMTGALGAPGGIPESATSGVQVTNNQFHNLNGGAGAAHVYANEVSACTFTGNAHNLMNGAVNGKAYHFDRDAGGNGTARRCVVDGNVFHSATAAAGPAILLDTNITEGLSIRHNRYSYFATFLTDTATLISGTKHIDDNLRLI